MMQWTTFDARSGVSWYIKFIYTCVFLLLPVKCQVWDGCIDSYLLPGTDECYKIYFSVSGHEAWKKCTLPNIEESLRRIIPGSELRIIRFIWMGAIQEYPKSNTYLSYNNISYIVGKAPDLLISENCLALDVSELRYVVRDCDEVLPMVCEVHTKFIANAYNASANDACGVSTAVSLLPLPGCYVPGTKCPENYAIVREQSFHPYNITHIGDYPVPVVILRMKTKNGEFTKEGDTFVNSTTLCYIGPGFSVKTNLQLKRSSRALRLRVGRPGRTKWPPECVGAEVKHHFNKDLVLLFAPFNTLRPEESRFAWCYTTDTLTGEIVVSNRVIIPGNKSLENSYSCSAIDHPTVKRIDPIASCLRCFEAALSPCVPYYTDCDVCTDKICGPFAISQPMWRRVYFKKEFSEFRVCAENVSCAASVVWKFSQGSDCDGDGVIDCDDRLLRILSPRCNVTLYDPRDTPQFQRYWKCRTSPKRDFVDEAADGVAQRHFCVKYPNKRWFTGPEDIPLERSFHAMDLADPYEIEKITEELRTLKDVADKLPPNGTLTMNKTVEAILNISQLFDVSSSALQIAQQEVNASSLPELLETILIRAPLNFSFATPNLAVSKNKSIGFQLISDKPLDGLETFGKNPKQIPISSRSEIKTNQVEAAVILPRVIEDTSLVLVTFAKGSDFTSCKVSSNPKAPDGNRSVTYSGSFDEPIPIHEPTLASNMGNKGEEFDTDCSFRNDLVRGCINTHVVQVSLLDANGSYVQLPAGEAVDILFRTKIKLMLGQTKTCAYWKPQEGGWASDGCELIEGENGVDICRCRHLSHFAQLVSDATIVLGPHRECLRMMSICACVISLIGFTGIILAGVLSRKWREKTENRVMLHLSVAMALFMSLFLWAALAPNPRPALGERCRVAEPLSAGCKVAGAALHYAVLSSFCWMAVAAATHYLRFTTFTGTDSVDHFVLKASAVGWGVPVVPVAVLAAVQPATYAGTGRDFCYPTGAAFYLAVLTPVLFVMITNVVALVMILRVLFPNCFAWENDSPRLQRCGINERRDLIRKMILCVALTFLFGVTWYLGFLTFTVWAAYVFCVFMALHGPALLVFFVFGEENIRSKLCAKKQRVEKSDVGSTSGNTASTNSANSANVINMTNMNTGGRARRMQSPSDA